MRLSWKPGVGACRSFPSARLKNGFSRLIPPSRHGRSKQSPGGAGLRRSLMPWLFEEAFIEQLGATGAALVLQAEEQVPEVDSGDALPRKLSGARSAGARRLGGTWP